MFSAGRLSVDLVDYPGEWLLDLPLLGKSYDAVLPGGVRARGPRRFAPTCPKRWRETVAAIGQARGADASEMVGAARSFEAFCRLSASACKADRARACRRCRRGGS
jgi:predicted YcjX-like family ATPase